MGEAIDLRERIAKVGHAIESVDNILQSLGYTEPLGGLRPRSNMVVFFGRNELRKFILDELRIAAGQPISARDVALKVVSKEGKDINDRHLVSEIVKRVGKSFRLLKTQGVAVSSGKNGDLAWRLMPNSA